MAEPADLAPDHGVIVPDWPAPGGVRAACSTRAGGSSRSPWNSLNLGDHVGDDGASVAANRQAFARRIGCRPVFLRQVHGTRTVVLGSDTLDGTEADACFTRQRSLACTIMVADCLPVLLCDTGGGAVGAAHAGWRGLAGKGGQGVLESLMQRFEPGRTLAWLGPCIGPQAFEVGAEVRQAFLETDADCEDCFKPQAPGKWLADLPALARRRLQALGVSQVYGNNGTPGWCTVSQPSRFFSHRRDRVCGRMAASIWLG